MGPVFAAAAPDPPLFPEGPPLGGTIRWTGTAGLRIDFGGRAIAFDPFVTRPGLFAALFRPPRPDEARVRARFTDLSGVFVGHTHYDHAMDLQAVAAASPYATFYGGSTTLELLRRLGHSPNRLIEVADGSRDGLSAFEVRTLRSRHGRVPVVRHLDRADLPPKGLPRTPFRYPMGDVFAFRLKVGGRTFHIQGSAGIDDEALERQEPVDVLIPCLAARHGTPGYLERLGRVLKPKVLIPFHHDDFFRSLDERPRPVPGLDWPAFLEDARRLETAHGTRLVHLPRDVPVPF